MSRNYNQGGKVDGTNIENGSYFWKEGDSN